MGELRTRDDIEHSITHDFIQMGHYPTERHPIDHKLRGERGQLIDPVARMFEVRTNRALEELQVYLSTAALEFVDVTGIEVPAEEFWPKPESD